jgi:hypothetical protein
MGEGIAGQDRNDNYLSLLKEGATAWNQCRGARLAQHRKDFQLSNGFESNEGPCRPLS